MLGNGEMLAQHYFLVAPQPVLAIDAVSFLALTLSRGPLLHAFKMTASWDIFRACCLPPTSATMNPAEVCKKMFCREKCY